MIEKQTVLEMIDEYISDKYEEFSDDAYEAVNELRDKIAEISEER